MKELFTITVKVDGPIVIGQDKITGLRQLIPIRSGVLNGMDLNGEPMSGTVLPGGVDSQIIRPDGTCELSARYGVVLDNGHSFYIENNGIYIIRDQSVEQVSHGVSKDSTPYYFATTPAFEVYHENLRWMTAHIFVCKVILQAEAIEIRFYVIE